MLIEVEPGVKLFVKDYGIGKPIVFLHGWMLDHRIFEHQLTPLMQRGYRVIAIDLRGYGQSDKPSHGNNYDTWAQDVRKIISMLNLKDVTLVGFSTGGTISMHYISKYNDSRVTKLVLLASGGPCATKCPDNPYGVRREVIDQFINAMYTDQYKLIQEFLASLFHTPISSDYIHWIENIARDTSVHAIIGGMKELRDQDFRSELSNITIPTWIFHGIHDRIISYRLAEEYQRLIKNSEIIIFKNSGHGIFYDEKNKLIEEIANSVA